MAPPPPPPTPLANNMIGYNHSMTFASNVQKFVSRGFQGDAWDNAVQEQFWQSYKGLIISFVVLMGILFLLLVIIIVSLCGLRNRTVKLETNARNVHTKLEQVRNAIQRIVQIVSPAAQAQKRGSQQVTDTTHSEYYRVTIDGDDVAEKGLADGLHSIEIKGDADVTIERTVQVDRSFEHSRS